VTAHPRGEAGGVSLLFAQSLPFSVAVLALLAAVVGRSRGALMAPHADASLTQMRCFLQNARTIYGAPSDAEMRRYSPAKCIASKRSVAL
jgi:hypothetical protein